MMHGRLMVCVCVNNEVIDMYEWDHGCPANFNKLETEPPSTVTNF